MLRLFRGSRAAGSGLAFLAFHLPPVRVMGSNLDFMSTELMHARDLVEMAWLVAMHGQQVVEGDGQDLESGLQQYWLASVSVTPQFSASNPRARDRSSTCEFKILLATGRIRSLERF